MRNYFLVGIICFFVISSFCAAGQYYKFVDEKGVVYFTDDLSKIPKEKRSEVEVTREIKNALDPQNGTQSEIVESNDATDSDKLKLEAEELKAIKVELDKEAAEINSESIRLIEQGKGIKGSKNIDEYNIEIGKLNERTNSYQSKQAEYIKRANEHNAKVEQKKAVK